MDCPDRILVSDDSPEWQDIFGQLFAEAGCEVRTATTLQETRWQLERYSFALVIVDICLDAEDETNTDGVETMRMIRNLSEGTQAIVLTGYGNVELAVSALRELEVFHFLEKQKFEASIFMGVVTEALAKAHITSTQLRLSKDPLSFFHSVDLHRASSMLGLHLDRLQFILRHLIVQTGPIVPQHDSAQLHDSERGCLIVFDYWSKAYGCGAHLAVGDREALTIHDAADVLASVEEGKIRGLVEARKKNAFEDYLSR